MTDLTIKGGTLTASADDRTISGLLIPFGEEASSNLGKFKADSGSFTLPSDPSQVGINVEHERESAFGHAVTLGRSSKGVTATFRAAETEEGDTALADIAAGRRLHLSAEVKGVQIVDGRAVAGRLFAAALVEKPAFPSATLLAAAVEDDEETIVTETPADADAEEDTTEETTVNVYTDEEGIEHKATTTTTTTTTDDKTTITETTVIETPEPETPKEENTLTARLAQPRTPKPKTADESLTAFLSAVAGAHNTQDSTLLAAFKNVPLTGEKGLAPVTSVPEYLGELWKGRKFARRIIPLLSGKPLTSITAKGWRFTATPEVTEYDGNNAAVPSNEAGVEEVTWDFQRFAGGWGLDRAYTDFGEVAVIQAFLAAATDSYARNTDHWALARLLAKATSAPVGTLPTDVAPAVGMLVRGALRVIDADASPSYAILAPDLYEQLLFTKKDDVLAYLEMSLGLEEGAAAGFTITSHKNVPAGQALVGAKEAAAVDELGGSPIRVNAQAIANGKVDEALFGYVRFRDEYPSGVQLVTGPAAGGQ
ncbi:hypothetical protein D9V30_00635 [Mycetocola reblochoni]|uniref:Uncharacterized protein n=2 Tax=Mycetocola reblochoni TaxID=331618 RepID=A0A3L6ZSP6_9MICO|nr:hypothetical protein [Mycetocola reblochoni]RLP70973.1 hypothetical protein D9V30_00635 [Mycetocola reblochoni]SJN24075.1 Conserved hypothetical exported protein [Mycetocola reblochoni REB411]